MLSDFGADVIKIEPPGVGDPWRASTPIPGKKVDYYWQLSSRNKRSLALDLKILVRTPLEVLLGRNAL